MPSELRERLDALTNALPLALRLPRNTVAVLALARGLEELGAELHRDPMALHRELAGLGSAPEGDGHAPGVLGELPVTAPSSHGASTERAPSTDRGPEGEGGERQGSHASRPATPRRAAPAGDASDVDSEALRDRWRRSGLGVTAFERRHGIARSILREWLQGAETRPKTLAKIAAALDAEGK